MFGNKIQESTPIADEVTFTEKLKSLKGSPVWRLIVKV